MYDKNAYMQMVIGKLLTYLVKDGYEVRRHKKEQEKFLDGIVIGMNPTQFINRIHRDYEIAGNAYVYKASTESGVFV